MKKVVSYFLIGLFIAIMAFIVSSCNSYKKQLNKFQTFGYQHTNELAKMCAEKFPVKDSVGAPVIDSTKRADNINYQGRIDSLKDKATTLQRKMYQDSVNKTDCAKSSQYYKNQVTGLVNQISSLQQSYKPCKPDTIFKTNTVYRKDVAELSVVSSRFRMANDSLHVQKQLTEKSEKTARTRLYLIIGLIVAFVGSISISVLKFIGKI